MVGTATRRCLVTLLIGSAAMVLLPGSGRGADKSPAYHFARDVVPVLTKLGCNAGACHGSFQGRGHFRLSLLGFDPDADYEALVKEARGRRVFAASPDQSLFLLKGTGRVPHGGGKKLDPNSEQYRIFRDWIARGLPAPSASDPVVSRLSVQPSELTPTRGQKTTLHVQAHWSDGATTDVGRDALFESLENNIATVSPVGGVEATGPGRTAITVRFGGQVAAVPVTVPAAQLNPYPPFPRQNAIDDLVAAEWKKLGVLPAPLSSDSEFIRRVYLDLIGTLPSAEETREFLKQADPAKRSRLIDSLLARPEYADYWSLKWGDLLRAHRRSLGEKGLESFLGWIRQALRENRPMDHMVRELLTAEGNLYSNGAVAFYFVDTVPQDLAETTSQLFLGVKLQCARCHHHPFDVWSQDDYYQMAAFFSRIERKDTKESGRFGGSQSVRVAATGQMTHPATGAVVAPRCLGDSKKVDETIDPRRALAEWVTSPGNPYFAKNIVNRYWSYLLGRGLVEPVDDLRATNPPTHPALLDAMTKDFVTGGFDVKRLVRTICNSRVYQLAGAGPSDGDADGKMFTRRVPRRMPAEVLLDALNQAAGTVEVFQGLPTGMRAISLPDTATNSYFLDTFGRPRRTGVCECDRSSQSDLRQALHLANSEAIHQKVTAGDGRLAKLLVTGKSDAELVEELYLVAFSRLPTDDERKVSSSLVAAAPDRATGFQDLLWALLNCAEFTFNH